MPKDSIDDEALDALRETTNTSLADQVGQLEKAVTP